MTDPNAELSRTTFDRLIARAIEIDVDGRERLNLLRAREIADELGISAAAWEAALQERRLEALTRPEGSTPSFNWTQVLLCAGLGLAIGGFTKTASSLLNSGDLSLIAIVAGAVGIGLHGAWQRTGRSVHLSLLAWWCGVLTGLTLSFGRVPSSKFLLVVIPIWAGASVISTVLVRRLRSGAAVG